MAAAKFNPAPVVAGVVVPGVALAAGGLWWGADQNAAAVAAARDAADVPHLPTGRLKQVRLSVTDARFVALDELKRSGDQVSAMVVVLGRTAGALEGGASITSQRKIIDCAKSRVFDGKVGHFDAEGRLLRTEVLYSGRQGRLIDPQEVDVTVACGSGDPPTVEVFESLQAAQRQVQTPPTDLAEIAERHPDDAHLWAWLCTSAARGNWREEAPADCVRAVKLNPDLIEVRLDKAFLDLKIGNNAATKAELRGILLRDGSNPAALFGRGLLAEMAGDKAASQRDYHAALKADSNIRTWLERRYRFWIDPDYGTERGRADASPLSP